MPEISIIVPVFRAEKYLNACVDSILSQTFSDFELVLIEDGSPDQSGAICDEYAQRDERVRVIHQSNQGQAAARNHALPMTQGKWLCYVDSDDMIHPQMLELLYEAAVRSGAGISMCQMREAPELPPDFTQPRALEYELMTMDEPTLTALHDREAYPGWVACAKLIRRELVEGYPFHTGRVYEDNEAVSRWLLPAKTLAMLPEKLYFYRTNPESTTKSGFSLKRLDYLWALESIISYYRSVGFTTLAQRFLDRYVEAAASACYGVRNELGRQELVGRITAQVRRFLRQEKLGLSREQRLCLMDAAHPQAMARFWSAAETVRKVCRRPERGSGK